jgi:outer membrane receptor protein involved in Fe transport
MSGVASGVGSQRSLVLRSAVLAGLLLMTPASRLIAQDAPQEEPAASDTLKPVILKPLAVTATRAPRDIYVTAAPISVLDTLVLHEQTPNTAADVLKNLPGLDINGVGTNQTRPSIRGQRGQRILLLEDGLRMNNARRQSDFGELPAIVGINALQQVEVVRGPASVLYGTDAIGGVINLRTSAAPPPSAGDLYGGRVSFVYRDEGEQIRPNVDFFGRAGRLGFRGTASYRNADDFFAPSGTFGDITLDDDVRVFGTGVEDQNYSLVLDYAASLRHSVFVKGELYKAADGGFGYVSNEDLGDPDAVSIIISYPDQEVRKLTAGYRGSQLGWAVADRVDVTGYYMDNERDFVLDVFIPFGSPAVGLSVLNENFTDLESVGVRAEAAKLLAGRHLLTYGLDYYRDDSQNTDTGTTTFIGGPPGPPDVDNKPRVPFATYSRFGLFAQGDLALHDRVSLILGARFQDVRSKTKDTPGLDEPLVEGIESDEQTVVGAANLLVEVAPYLNLVGTVGRGFRAPNLIELYFTGPTPEGAGFLVPNPGLEAETSLNFDAGLKYRRSNVAFEGYYFRNEIRDGIRIEPVPDSVIGPFQVFQDVNVDKLRFQGIELLAEYSPVAGLTLGASFSWLDSENVLDENDPIADSYSTKFTGDVSYRDPRGRFWAGYDVRINGDREICSPTDEECKAQVVEPAIGLTLPSFNVHNLRAGVKLFEAGRTAHNLAVSVENITDELYAEFSNATFFRPQPRRTFLVSWVTTF